MSEPTPLNTEELAALKAGFGLAAAVMPEHISAAKRVHVSKSEWLTDWWVGYGKDDSCQIEGTRNHWRWLAHLLLGLAADRDAPYSEDKPLDEPVARLFATIDAQATEIAALKGALTERDALLKALEPTIAYAMAHSWTEPDFAELERLRVLAGKEAQGPSRGPCQSSTGGGNYGEWCRLEFGHAGQHEGEYGGRWEAQGD